MNIEQIRQLAQICRENGLSAIDVSEGESHIRLERGLTPVAPAIAPIAAAADDSTAPKDAGVDFNDIIEVKSPMVGVFYAGSSPESAPFVKVGDRVKKGDVLCIVEAMKLMNEISAPTDGEIIDICPAGSGEVVEFGQTLFKLYEREAEK